MTYKKLYEDALFKLEHNKITLGEFEEMIKPLEREVEQEPVLDKIRAEIKHFMYDVNPSSSESDYACNYILQIIDKYKTEQEKA